MVDMQRRHFEFIARILQETERVVDEDGFEMGYDEFGLQVPFASALAKTNRNFNRERSLATCKRRD